MAFQIKFTVTNEAAVSKQALNAIVKGEWLETGDRWHKKFRKGHFALTAYTKYSYSPRNKRYNFLKQKKLGHVIPLVLSGTSRGLSETKQITAHREGVSVQMPVRVFNFKTRNSKVDKRKEFTTVIPEEVTFLEKRYQVGLERRIKSHQGRRDVKV